MLIHLSNIRKTKPTTARFTLRDALVRLLRPHLVLVFVIAISLNACDRQTGDAPETESKDLPVAQDSAKHPETTAHSHLETTAEDANLKYIKVEHAWVRALAPSQKSTAAYFDLINVGTTDQVLVSVSTPVAEKVEMHLVLTEGEQLQMRPVDQMVIVPAQRLEFKPGAQHLMLIGLRQPLQENDQVPLRLSFKSGAVITVGAFVRKTAKEAASGHGHH